MQEHLNLLGFKVRDVVTGFTGVVSSISFDLYGCIQAIVTPEFDPKNAKIDSRWFDVKRLVITSTRPVMLMPAIFGQPNPTAPRAAECVAGGQDLSQYPEKP